MIYTENKEYHDKLYREVAFLLDNDKMLLHEYYEKINRGKDSHILGGLKIYVYKIDRGMATPHIHIVDEENHEIEVSLIDWRIVNVKNPSGKTREWSSFASIRDKFFRWLNETEENSKRIFDVWNNNNKDNQLDNKYINDSDISEELRNYLQKNEDPDILLIFQKELYGELFVLFSDEKEREKLENLDVLSLLKEIDFIDKFGITEDSQEILRLADKIIKNVKICFQKL